MTARDVCLAAVCPRCAAWPGQPCVTPAGHRLADPHIARRIVAGVKLGAAR